VKQIVSISLGKSADDYEFVAEFLGQQFTIKRVGTDGDVTLAADLMEQWSAEADAICLGGLNFDYAIGSSRAMAEQAKKVKILKSRITAPITTGERLRRVSYEWAITASAVQARQQLFQSHQSAVSLRYAQLQYRKGDLRMDRQPDLCRSHL
jgi:hypothetical protein